jgi:hypothetical protein
MRYLRDLRAAAVYANRRRRAAASRAERLAWDIELGRAAAVWSVRYQLALLATQCSARHAPPAPEPGFLAAQLARG